MSAIFVEFVQKVQVADHATVSLQKRTQGGYCGFDEFLLELDCVSTISIGGMQCPYIPRLFDFQSALSGAL